MTFKTLSKIERHNSALGNDPSTANTTKEWWEVVTTDGTRYRLGWNEDSEQLALMYGYSCTTDESQCTTPDGAYASSGYAGRATNLVAMRWRVDKVEDVHGNFMTYTYKEELPASGAIPQFDRASYIESIAYTDHTTLTPMYEVYFDFGSRAGDIPTEFNVWDNFDQQQLNNILICYGSCIPNPGPDDYIRRYHFDYSVENVPNTKGTLVLKSLEISSGELNVAGVSSTPITSPKIKFTYENLPNRAVSGTQDVFTYPRLETIENGYGGSLNYTYENDGRPSTSWYNYRVKTATVETGVATAAIRGYAYVTPVYTGTNNTGELIGYTDVNEITYDFDGTTKLAETSHHFGTEGLDIGYELATESKDSAGVVLQKSTSAYVTDNSQAPFEGWNYRYLYETANYIKSGASLVLSSKTIYIHDAGTGNLALRQDYIGGALYRKQYSEYKESPDKTDPNSSVHILDKATRQLLVDANNNTISDTRYVYDGGAGSLTKGELTLVQRLFTSTSTSDTRYEYDAYGNVTKTCVYKTYGVLNVTPTGGLCNEVTYDNTTHTYPIQSKNPLGQISTSNYIYQLGLAYQATDPNGWTTTSTYDALGRTLSVTPPGFPIGKAGTKYTYPVVVDDSVEAPYNVKMELWDGTANTYRSVWGIYDGMGRILETQTWDSDRDQRLISESQFNAQGLVSRQSLPYYAGGTGGVHEGAGSQFTETVYDALGRAVQVTSPGDIVSSTQYDGLTTTSIDPNGNKVTRTTDGLGRLKFIQEFNESTVYSLTTFSYDAADRLVTTKDAQSNVSTLTYDNLGRKTGMDDPDMGVWTYEYDALGNLIKQDDARGQTLSFTYDDLNRLTQKKDFDLNTVLASYTYGSTSPEIGFRKTMTDPSGSATWTYSDYGRTVAEAKTINASQKTTTTTSDWLGRVLTVTYPDSEVLTYQYDALGRAKSFKSNQNAFDFASIGYNELSQMMNVNLGNGVQVENSYNPITHRLENKLAQKGSAIFLDFDYQYDQAGNITELTDQVLDELHAYQYDFLNRLTLAEARNDTDYAYRQTFEYDKVGNILTRQDWEISDLIFKNDFESATPSGWTNFVSDVGEIWTVASNAFPPVSGQRSIVFDINDNNALYAEDTTPGVGGDETQYRARFYFNPNSLVMAGGDILDLFTGYKSGGTQVFRVQLQKSAGAYQLRVGALNDASAWTDSAWTTISNQWTSIEINYLSADNTGSLGLWINGASVQTLSAIDNSTHPINKVQLGAGGVETGTRGQILYDAFESRRLTYMGPLVEAQASTGMIQPVAYRVPGSSGEFSTVDDAPRLVVDSGWISPTTDAAVTSSSGDNNGFQTNPTTAYTDDATFAVDTDTGSSTSTLCTDTGKDRHDFYTYDFSSLPGDASIVGIEVKMDMKVDSTSGAPKSCIELSWDGGTTWTTSQTTSTFTTSEASYILGGSADTWGRSWTLSELNTFRVRITNVSSGTKSDFSLDWIPVRIYYNSSAPTSTPTITPTITDTPTVTATEPPIPSATNTPSNTPSWTQTASLTPSRTLAATYTPPSANDTYMKALLHMDGTDAATSFLDQSGRGWTVGGNAQLDTAQLRFGSASGLFDGNGDYISSADHIDWQLDGGSNSNEWTVDFWVQFNGDPSGSYRDFVVQQADTSNLWWIRLTNANQLQFAVVSGESTTVNITNAWNPAGSTWYHVAVVKQGTTGYKMFINGTQIGTTQTDTSVIPNFSASMVIGGTSHTGYLNGWLDEIRISKGIARWTSNFTPPDGSYYYGLTPTSTATLTPVNTNTPTKTPSITPTVQTPTATPTMNLAAIWSFDEVTGTVPTTVGVIDSAPSSTPQSNGTLIAGARRVPGFGANAIQLVTGQYINFPRQAEMEPASGITLSMWLFPTEMDQGKTYIILNKGGAWQDYRLYINSDGFLVFLVNDVAPNEVIGPKLELYTWTHVTAIYDRPAGMLKLYLNGGLAASRTVTGSITYDTSSGITIGAATNGFIGVIDDVYLNRGALLDPDVTATLASLTAIPPHFTFVPSSTPTATFTNTATKTQTPTKTYTPTKTPTPPAISFTPSNTPTVTVPPTITNTPVMNDMGIRGDGHDGSLVIGSGATFNINTSSQNATRTLNGCADAVAYNVTSLGSTAADVDVAPGECLAAGDEILLINLQGNHSSVTNVGNYEFLRVASVNTQTVFFETPKVNWYGEALFSDSNIGTGPDAQKVMLLRVPNYYHVTVDGTLTGSSWNGSKYGVIAFRVNGTLAIGSTGLISANGLGYRGGPGGPRRYR